MFLERIPTVQNPAQEAENEVREVLRNVVRLTLIGKDFRKLLLVLEDMIPFWGLISKLLQIVIFVLIMSWTYNIATFFVVATNAIGGFPTVVVISALSALASVVFDIIIAKNRPDIAETGRNVRRLLLNLTWLNAVYKEELGKILES